MEEKDLEQLQGQEGSKITWKEELEQSKQYDETVNDKIDRRLEELEIKRNEIKKEDETPKQKALWSNKKIKKYEKVKYREQKCKEWEVRIVRQNM